MGMPKGFQMMLKSFGIEIDIEAIQAQVVAFQSNLANLLSNFDGRLVAVEKRLAAMEEQQCVMLNTLLIIQQQSAPSDVRPAGDGAAMALLAEAGTNGRSGSN